MISLPETFRYAELRAKPRSLLNQVDLDLDLGYNRAKNLVLNRQPHNV